MALAGATGVHVAPEERQKWIGSGSEVPAGLSPEEMAVEAGAAFKVEKWPLYASKGDRSVEANHSALVRADTGVVLSLVPNGWHSVQNSEAFASFKDFVDAGSLKMYAAGTFDEGRKVWAMAKIDRSVTVLGKDRTEGYLLFTNPHEYGKAVDIRLLNRQLICENQIPLLLSSTAQNAVKITHRVQYDVSRVAATMAEIGDKFTRFSEAAEFLAERQYNEEEIQQYFGALFPKTSGEGKGVAPGRSAIQALEALDTHPGHNIGPGTWWRAFSCATFMTSHVMGKKAEVRQNSLWYGAYGERNRKALNLALEMSRA